MRYTNVALLRKWIDNSVSMVNEGQQEVAKLHAYESIEVKLDKDDNCRSEHYCLYTTVMARHAHIQIFQGFTIYLAA